MHANASIWTHAQSAPRYPQIEADVEVDVAIVGGGLTGITAALLLADAGKKVAVLEARRLGSGVSERSTAHVTEAVDTRYAELEWRDPGLARAVRESSRVALNLVAQLARQCEGQAGFRRVPGYLFSEDPKQEAALRGEAAAALRAGARVEVCEVPLSIAQGVGVRFEDQAEIDPVAYVNGLARRAVGSSVRLFEESLVVGLSEVGRSGSDRVRLDLDHGPTVTATDVILATHSPFTRASFQTKLAQYRSYVVAGPVAKRLDALYWDTADPYHYVRSVRRGDTNTLIVGGEDHKTGHEPAGGPQAPFDRLTEYSRRLGCEPSLRWSAQVVESVDGLPYIGQPTEGERVHVATGFGGNGTTFGTLAALVLCDHLLGKTNPYAAAYRATRLAPATSLPHLLKENVDFPLQLLRDRLRASPQRSAAELDKGEGAVLEHDGERLAVYRDDAGQLHAVSALCTHLGCQVAFNASERSWDCPCHGSRFDVDGAVLDGPANRRLAKRLL